MATVSDKKTAIVTGALGGIGAGLVEAFLKEGYNVVATSRDVSQSLTAAGRVLLKGASAADLVKSMQTKTEPVAGKGEVA